MSLNRSQGTACPCVPADRSTATCRYYAKRDFRRLWRTKELSQMIPLLGNEICQYSETWNESCLSHANNPNSPHSRFAASVASHISTLFIFNTFRSNGQKLVWSEMLEDRSRVFVIQLKGLEYSLERAVTELLLWNLIGYIEALEPSPLRCFIYLTKLTNCSLIKVLRLKSY